MTRLSPLIQAIERANLSNGATLSFHHHLRNGDRVMEQVIGACRTMGLRDLHIAPSSLFPRHGALIPALQDGTVTRITTSYMNGPLADAVLHGALTHPATLQTHGGRAFAIETGRLPIDCAFIAAPAVDSEGNLTGAQGRNACGPLGYAMVDAKHANHCIAITDQPAEPLSRICIPAQQINEVVQTTSIGDSGQIVSGTTSRAPSTTGRIIADLTADLIRVSGLLRNGFTFQTGAGATSLAVASALAPMMRDAGITGRFAAGGITQSLVEMARSGLFEQLEDVQAFDLAAVASYRLDSFHNAMSAAKYASPGRSDTIASQLDVMILGAAEVDTQFNVNVTQSGTGQIIGGSGGHADTAAKARMPIVTTQLAAGGFAKIVDQLTCLTTPGDTIAAVVTEEGIAIHPSRPDLKRAAIAAGLPVRSLEELRAVARSLGHEPRVTQRTNRIVATCESPKGGVIDRIQLKNP
jgi:citrate lyase subunit alpha/citrate CoA-transferase